MEAMMRGTVAGVGALAALWVGCGGGGGTPTGHERGACYPNATCDPGLSCLSDLCVRAQGDGAAGAGADASGTAGSAAGTGGRGGTSGSSGTGGTFAPAPHPALPQVANLGGPVMSAPKVLPIFFAGDPDTDAIKSFLGQVGASAYWRATTSEYGVGALTMLPPVMSGLSGLVTDDALQAEIAAKTSSSAAPWGAADQGTIYLYVLPPSITLSYSGLTCCTSFGGYHDETKVNKTDGVAVPYVAACACPDFFGPGWNEVDERTGAMSHELVEAATDPFPRSDTAFYAADRANTVWTLVTGGELGDMCVVDFDSLIIPTGISHVVQRSWSNAAAKMGRDPCVPAQTTAPYFNSMPVLDLIPYGEDGYETRGVQIPVGGSRTIDLDLFSAGPIPNGWQVSVYSYEEFFGGTPSLTFSLDRNGGNNGDVLRLTITALQTNPVLGADPFLVLSTIGTPGDTGFRGHVSMGLVTN